jgi:glycyl-tRNA synthetase beta chain
MTASADLLVEIGTEELPPKALRGLMDAFAGNLGAGLDAARLEHGEMHAYASPRRLAVLVESLVRNQADQHASQKGPARLCCVRRRRQTIAARDGVREKVWRRRC